MNNRKIVVYTAITNNYDSLKEPTFISPNVDYICFTDNKDLVSDIWEVRLIDNTLTLDHTRKARKYKILPHHFLKEYEYSIWIDGRYLIKGDLVELLNKHLTKSNLAVYNHPQRNCIYQEAKAVVAFRKEEYAIAKKQCNFYRQKGYPKRNGLIASPIILRKHNDQGVRKLMEDWWEQILLFSKRDQLSFNYCAWKNNFNFEIINEGTYYDNNYLDIFKHLK
ncbi:hypothetical protein FIU87_07175 [Bacillus sp. THAF10]|uniref:glycosyltransferase domain-containing protein n=1 Tax=Bacillus sp. THAF10 TaxID=2587848 RepID=UPI001268CADC|nr:glycosyltransferase domain-containing protein [Bacillus sp. THAF10]QFT88420.1 hypothetical protein FIU87_07175 [Bacillus sp. THAF10]